MTTECEKYFYQIWSKDEEKHYYFETDDEVNFWITTQTPRLPSKMQVEDTLTQKGEFHFDWPNGFTIKKIKFENPTFKKRKKKEKDDE